MLFSKCVVCDSKRLRFMKEQEGSGFLADMGKAIISPFNAVGKAFGSKIKLKNPKVGYNIVVILMYL